MGLGFLREKQDKFFLSLDIGTEAVKALILRKDNIKTLVLGASTQYFERYGVFDGKDFRTDWIEKAVSRALEQVYQNFSIFLAKEVSKKLKQDFKEWSLLLTLPPNIFKARIAYQYFNREKSDKKISKEEDELVCQQAFKGARQEISQEFAAEFGILPSEVHWADLKILGIKIDGYSVSGLQEYQGKKLEFKILATFLPRHYLENIEGVFRNLELKILKITHIAGEVPNLLKKKEADGVFLDVGGEVSQIFLVKKGELEKILDFEAGGRAFSQSLAERLGISEDSARILKERYSKGLLSPETKERLGEVFSQEKANWYLGLGSKVSPPAVFLFGGGSLIPEIRGVLKEKGIRVKFIYPKDLENIKDLTKKLKSPQYIPSLLTI